MGAAMREDRKPTTTKLRPSPRTACHQNERSSGRKRPSGGEGWTLPTPPPLGARRLSEGAVAGARLIDPPHGAPRNERRHVHDRHDAPFVADEVDIAHVIDEPRSGLDDLWRAGGIIASVEGQGARLDDHEARPRVRVPAKTPALHNRVLQDVEIRFTLGTDPGLPAARKRFRFDLLELPHGEDLAGDPGWRRRPRGPAVHGHTHCDDEKCPYESNLHLAHSFPDRTATVVATAHGPSWGKGRPCPERMPSTGPEAGLKVC